MWIAAFLWLAGVGFFVLGATVVLRAPAVTQEMAGLLLILCGIVSLGFGAVLTVLHDLRKDWAGAEHRHGTKS
jgi:hypothetical protein